MVDRLSSQTLSLLPETVRLPAYERKSLTPGIVHLGLGAFFRAHGAEYTDDVLGRGHADWGIIGASLQRPDQRDRLKPQDGLYTLLERGPAGTRARVIGSVLDVVVAREDTARLLATMVDPAIRIVTLTVTEKGYCHIPATGRLNEAHPDILHDLGRDSLPVSAIGLIVAALDIRRQRGRDPFTVLSCDNLPTNGALTRQLLHDFAALRSDALASWIERNVATPSSMVDRIVPASTQADLLDAQQCIGLRDAGAVSHEPFRQWVIEDCFVEGRRPSWELAGAQMVSDVTPYEHMKLRMLNASHSALAYLGYMAGFETIAETSAHPAFQSFLNRLWKSEIIPVLPRLQGVDLTVYAGQLLTRYLNPAIRHRTWQIAMDGSQKLPQRLLGSVRDRLAQGKTSPCICLAVAAWLRYIGGVDERGQIIDVRDPLLGAMQTIMQQAGGGASGARAVLSMPEIFGADLPHEVGFVADVMTAYQQLITAGALKTLAGQA